MKIQKKNYKILSLQEYLRKSYRYLSYRERSEKEIRDYLSQSFAPQEIIQEIVAKLTEQKFLNDTDFARSWVRQRKLVRPKSIRVIKMELKQKGISDEIIEETVQEGMDDFALAWGLTQKKIRVYESLSKEELYQKLGGYLSRKGFGYSIIRRVIDELLSKRV